MAHFAKINENNIVEWVIVVDNAYENNGQDYINNKLGLSGTWIQTSYNTYGGIHKLGGTPIRKNYAGIGYTYDPINDAFIPIKPYQSWILNQDTYLWEAPIQYPNDGFHYEWNEENLTWDFINTVEEESGSV
jgi:hypothetical protein